MKKFEKLVFLRIDECLYPQILTPNKSSIWITDENLEKWFFEYRSDGVLIYNGILFTEMLKVFTLRPSEIANFIKNWFEKKMRLPVRQINRKNSLLDYELSNFKKKISDLTLKDRYGFSYDVVKKYKDLQNLSETQTVFVDKFILT